MRVKMLCCLVCMAFLCPIQAKAWSVYCTNCSNNLVQMLERITNVEQLSTMLKEYDEAITQTMQQIEMVRQNVEQYANMVQNTIQLPQRVINQISANFKQLAAAGEKLATLRGDVSALSQIHQSLYMGQNSIRGMTSVVPNEMATLNGQLRTEWDKWSARVDEASEATFQLSGSQLHEMQQDSDKFQDYVNELLSTPEGQQQALMAGNQLAAMQIQEMRQMRELMATQAQSHLATQMKTEKESQTAKELSRKLFDTSGLRNLTPTNDPF